MRGGPEHELTGVEDERRVGGHLDQLGEVTEVLLHVDDAARVVEEDEEPRIEGEVDRRRLDAGLVERVDDDAAGGELLADRTVRQDHGSPM